jgi:hypothetical protein
MMEECGGEDMGTDQIGERLQKRGAALRRIASSARNLSNVATASECGALQ